MNYEKVRNWIVYVLLGLLVVCEFCSGILCICLDGRLYPIVIGGACIVGSLVSGFVLYKFIKNDGIQ